MILVFILFLSSFIAPSLAGFGDVARWAAYSTLTLGGYPIWKLTAIRRRCARFNGKRDECIREDGCIWTSTDKCRANGSLGLREYYRNRVARCNLFTDPNECSYSNGLGCEWDSLTSQCSITMARAFRLGHKQTGDSFEEISENALINAIEDGDFAKTFQILNTASIRPKKATYLAINAAVVSNYTHILQEIFESQPDAQNVDLTSAVSNAFDLHQDEMFKMLVAKEQHRPQVIPEILIKAFEQNREDAVLSLVRVLKPTELVSVSGISLLNKAASHGMIRTCLLILTQTNDIMRLPVGSAFLAAVQHAQVETVRFFLKFKRRSPTSPNFANAETLEPYLQPYLVLALKLANGLDGAEGDAIRSLLTSYQSRDQENSCSALANDKEAIGRAVEDAVNYQFAADSDLNSTDYIAKLTQTIFKNVLSEFGITVADKDVNVTSRKTAVEVARELFQPNVEMKIALVRIGKIVSSGVTVLLQRYCH